MNDPEKPAAESTSENYEEDLDIKDDDQLNAVDIGIPEPAKIQNQEPHRVKRHSKQDSLSNQPSIKQSMTPAVENSSPTGIMQLNQQMSNENNPKDSFDN